MSIEYIYAGKSNICLGETFLFSGRMGGYIMLETDVDEPQNDKSTWRAYNEASKGLTNWENDRTVQVDCACAGN